MSEILVGKMQELSREFDAFVLARHEGGAEKYGPFKFLGADVIQETLEELGDIANYVRYQYIKLRLLQELLADDPRLASAQATIGVESFKGKL